MPTNRKLLPARRPKFQRHAMVPFLGIEAANVATNWFFGARVVEAQASASGTSTAAAFQFEGADGTAVGAGAATASPTRILQAAASAVGTSTLGATAIRWSQVASGTTSAWGQVFAIAIRQPVADGTLAGRATTTSATGVRQRNAIATAAGSTTVLCNPWIVAVGSVTGSGAASGATTRLRNAIATGTGRATNAAAGIRVVLLTAETLAGTCSARVDIWTYADCTALSGAAVLAALTATWQAASAASGVTTLDGIPTRILAALGVAAGASTAALDPTIRIKGGVAGGAAVAGAAIRITPDTATSAGHATQCTVGRRIQYGNAPASGAVLIGATGSWVKTVYGYAEGQGEAVAGSPDWRQTASAFCGCGSVLSTVDEFAGLIVTTRTQAAGSCPQVSAIPDANIVLVDAAEPAQADGLADATAAPYLIFWPEPFVCEQASQIEAVPETILDAQIVLVETPGWLSGDVQFAITMAVVAASGWSLALAASDPIERLADAQANGAALVEYQEPIFVVEPTFIEGFTDVTGHACSSEWVEGRVWAWSGAEAVIAACWQEGEGVAYGNSTVRGLGGFPVMSTTRRTRGNSAVWARATKGAA